MIKLNESTFEKLKNLMILLIIPIFFTALFGFVYSKVYVEEISVAVLDNDNTSISRQVIQGFEDNNGLKVTYYVDSYEEIENLINSGEAAVGLIIPNDFQKEVQELKGPRALIFLDQSNIVVGNSAMSYISGVFNEINAEIQIGILEKNGMVTYQAKQSMGTLSFVERVLYEPQMNYFKYVMISFIGIFIQQTYIGTVVPLFIKKKKEYSQKAINRKDIKELILQLLKFGFTTIVTSIICLIIAGKLFGHPLRGNLILGLLVHLLFIVNLTAVALIISAVFDNVTHSVQFTMLLSVPTILTAGTIWPEYLMPDIFRGIVKSVWPLIYYVNPMKSLQLKGAGFSVIQPYLVQGIIFAIIWVPIGVVVYKMKIKTIKNLEKQNVVFE